MLHFTLMLVPPLSFAKLFRDQGIVILINLFGLAINATLCYCYSNQTGDKIISLLTLNSLCSQIMSSYGENNIERMNKLIFQGRNYIFLTLLITCPIILESEYLLNLCDQVKLRKQFNVYITCIVECVLFFPLFLVQTIHATGKLRKIQIITSSIYLFNTLCCYLALWQNNIFGEYIFLS